MAHALRKHPAIAQLSLSACAIGDEGAGILALLLKANPSIRAIDLSRNSIGAEGLESLMEAIRGGAGAGLEYLDLSYNPIGDLGLMALSR